MIWGIGHDVVQIPRIESMLSQHEESFLRRVFTLHEQQASERYQKEELRAAHFAKRFAAKEAFSKALGTGVSGGIHFVDIGVESDKQGKPTIQLTGETKRIVKDIIGQPYRIFLSLSDDYPVASANVIIDLEP